MRQNRALLITNPKSDFSVDGLVPDKKRRNIYMSRLLSIMALLLLLLAAGSLFRSFERIDFQFFALYLNFSMGCKVANTGRPFLYRRRVGAAYLTDSSFDNPITSFT